MTNENILISDRIYNNRNRRLLFIGECATLENNTETFARFMEYINPGHLEEKIKIIDLPRELILSGPSALNNFSEEGILRETLVPGDLKFNQYKEQYNNAIKKLWGTQN